MIGPPSDIAQVPALQPSISVPALGYQPLAMEQLRLLECTGLAFDAPILHVGADAADLVLPLLKRGYANHVVIAENATDLAQCQQQLPPAQAERVLWVVDDVACSGHVAALDPVLLWHDRTRVHELATVARRAGYRRLLNHMMSAHGWVLLGVEPTEASQLPVAADALAMQTSLAVTRLADFIGADYTLRHVLEEVHLSASNEAHPRTYALFQRNDTCRQGAWVNP
jgi:hypothetical protein